MSIVRKIIDKSKSKLTELDIIKTHNPPKIDQRFEFPSSFQVPSFQRKHTYG